ncbi:MAG: hypothetical protein ACO1O6_01425 [Bacteroidota bacterium]
MKKLIAGATCFAFLGLGLLSCRKEVVNPLENPTAKESKSNLPDKDANFENPYEFVGEVHNIALENGREVMLSTQQSGSSQSGSGSVGSVPDLFLINKVFEAVRESVKSELDARGYSSSIIPELSQELIFSIQNQSPDEVWEEMLLDMDKAQRQVMVKFEQDLQNYIDHGNINLAISNMKNLENQVSNNPKITGEDRVMMLSMLALGRYSFMYWANEDEENPGPAYLSNGKWRADIGAFRADWKQHKDNPTWGFREHWNSAASAGSSASSLQ